MIDLNKFVNLGKLIIILIFTNNFVILSSYNNLYYNDIDYYMNFIQEEPNNSQNEVMQNNPKSFDNLLVFQEKDSLADSLVYFTEEEDPKIDYKRLHSLICYPDDVTIQEGEIKVIIKVLIDKNGYLKKHNIEKSNNDQLSKLVIKAIQQYGRYPILINKGEPSMYWVSIPVILKFR